MVNTLFSSNHYECLNIKYRLNKGEKYETKQMDHVGNFASCLLGLGTKGLVLLV